MSEDQDFEWSDYQNAFFERLVETGDSIMLTAVAGSGKSTTIVEGVHRLSDDANVSFLAFNKHTADELKPQMPKNARAKTFHSAGFNAWAQANGGYDALQVNGNKVSGIVRDQLSDAQYRLYGTFVIRLVGYAKNSGVCKLHPNEPKSYRTIINHHGLYIDSLDSRSILEVEEEAIYHAIDALETSNRRHSVIDYDDMLYLPLINDVTFWKNDVIFVDEAQDTNRVQLHLLKRMVKSLGRVIAVGDPAQAIYGFRGASANALDEIIQEFDMVELGLNVSYRCSREVVKEAKKLVDHIEPSETAREGSVTEWKPDEDVDEEIPDFRPTDAVLCRVNAPLFSLAFKIIADGKGCKILGRDIGEGLISLIKKIHTNDIDEFGERLNAFEEREVTKFLRVENHAGANAIRDRTKCIRIVIDNLPEDNRSVESLINSIRSLFDSRYGVTTLCTIHKAKGLEWLRVFILEPELLPHPMARKTWERIQERNLEYVAVTRSKEDLVYLPMEKYK